jgi:RNA polymerase sigma-70 factor (ECF subfamily)
MTGPPAWLATAHAAWPAIAIPDDEFVRYVEERAAGADPARLHVADLYLACACARGDQAAIALLEQKHIAHVPRDLVAAGESPAVVDEVSQQLRYHVLVADGQPPRIASYGGRGPLGGWLHIVALRLAGGLRRRERDHAPLDESDPPTALPVVDPELALVKEKYGPIFSAAFKEAFAALSSDERNLFRLFYLDGLNLDGLAVVLQVSRATAGRRMLAARERLLEGTLDLLRARLALDTDELESLLGVVRSRLEVSLHALLAAG